MIADFVKMSWDELQDYDIKMKSNTTKHVVQINGSELKEEDDSIILAYYNLYSGELMVLIQHYDGIRDIEIEEVPGYYGSKEEIDGVYPFTEIVYLQTEIKAALSE